MLILLTFNTELRKMNIFAASTKIIKKFKDNYFLNNFDFAFYSKCGSSQNLNYINIIIE